MDNYDPPKSQLSGQIEYNGLPVRVKGTYGAIQLQLYQSGYALNTPISVFVDQDGKFEATLFDGNYKLVTRDKNGPWVNSRDTTIVNVKGNSSVKLEVTPYFTISNSTVSLNGAQLTGSCTVDKVVSTANLSFIKLFINGTSFVDENINVLSVSSNALTTGSNTFSYTLSADQQTKLNSLKGIYARIGVKTQGADQAIYSEVFQLK
jgi:hypothetical protein